MSNHAKLNEPEVLTFNSLLALLNRRSRQSIYDLMRRDPSFPRPRQIGSEFSIGWLRGEVFEWLNTRPPVELNVDHAREITVLKSPSGWEVQLPMQADPNWLIKVLRQLP